jgi:hypothetical protein
LQLEYVAYERKTGELRPAMMICRNGVLAMLIVLHEPIEGTRALKLMLKKSEKEAVQGVGHEPRPILIVIRSSRLLSSVLTRLNAGRVLQASRSRVMPRKGD